MYSIHPSFVLGFHGCDKSVAESVFSGQECLKAAPKDYDWLGHGIYFWENSPERAMQWAEEKKLRSKGKAKDAVSVPAVVGVEGDALYENAGFNEKNHIQICVRNPNCIKGYFRPIPQDPDYPIP